MKTFPMDSIITGLDDKGLPIFDRPYKAQDLRNTMMTFFKDGVFSEQSDELQVFPSGGGMTVNVHSGRCLIRGAQGIEEQQRTLQLQAAEEALDRIDTVVARLDVSQSKRAIDLYIVKGTPALAPKAPELTRNSTVWEIGLADLYIPKAITAISQARISDTRLNEQRCGIVAPFVQLQTKTFYDELERQTNIAIQLQKDAISGTTAGRLQDNIDAVNAKFPVSIENGGTGVTKTDPIIYPMRNPQNGTFKEGACFKVYPQLNIGIFDFWLTGLQTVPREQEFIRVARCSEIGLKNPKKRLGLKNAVSMYRGKTSYPSYTEKENESASTTYFLTIDTNGDILVDRYNTLYGAQRNWSEALSIPVVIDLTDLR